MRRENERPHPPVKVLGVDDFAFRRGRSYGTILIDLERRCPIDLLPDRESDTLTRWLAAHPGVEIISRDRSKAYAEGASSGAPSAVQIADRWHLLKNLGEYLERLLLRHHSLWRNKLNQPLLSAASAAVQSWDIQKWSESMRPEVAARHQARSELYKQVFQLFEQGLGFEQIAELTGKSRRTIFRWIKEDSSPVRRKNRPSRLDPYRELLNQWCRDGQYNVIQLWEELQKQGYRGSSMAVRRYLHRHQFPAATGRRRAVKIKLGAETAHKPVMPLITPRSAVLKLLHTDRLKPEEKPLMGEILKSSPEIEKAVELGCEA
jgi:transposase